MEKIYFTNSRGEKLAGILTIPEGSKQIVVMCHGMHSCKDRPSTSTLSDDLNKRELATLRFDFAGHGDSEGNVEDVCITNQTEDLKAAVDSVSGKFKDIFLYGSSFGGAVVLAYTSRNKTAKLLALKAPVSAYSEIWEQKLGDSGLKEWEGKGFLERENAEGKKYKLKYSLYEDSLKYNYYLYELIKTPTLIVHGSRDESVPVKQSMDLSKHMPNAVLEIVKGADHRFTKKQHFVHSILSIANWFYEQAQQL